ncbi:MerR family transcriptional regulator [candidate division KSB1 bacterium]|nr:MerR family transcriptional regulator [candidate division KSB1 bacterium]
MAKEIITTKEIVEQTALDQDMLQKIVERKLVKPLGTVDENVLVFDKQTIQQIEQIKQFLEMGYSIEAIEKILKKVGLPAAGAARDQDSRKVKYLTVGELANRLNINPRTLKFWEERGIVEPDTRSDGGFRLYADYWIYLCQLIQDLQLFGYTLDEIKETSNLFRDFLAIQKSLHAFSYEETKQKLQTMSERIKLFYEKMSQLKEGIHRWEELLKKKEKEIRQFESKLTQLKTTDESKEKK